MRSLFLLLILVNCIVSAQQEINLNVIRSKYESFEYRDVINLSEKILISTDTINKSDLTEIYLMKAVSHYALAEEPQVRKCFIEILKIDRTFEPDSGNVSPKIVTFFRDVKNDFMQTVSEQPKVTPRNQESTGQINNDLLNSRISDQKSTIIRSLIFPGWGQLYSGETTKGTVIASAALINLSAMIYYIVDANSNEKKYLGESNPSLISSSYNTWNRSYKMRNILITSFILIYAYAQADILLIGGVNLPQLRVGIGGNNTIMTSDGFHFSLKFPL